MCMLHYAAVLFVRCTHENSLYDSCNNNNSNKKRKKNKSENVKNFLNRGPQAVLHIFKSFILKWDFSNIPTKMIEKSNRMEYEYFLNVTTTMNSARSNSMNKKPHTDVEPHLLDRVKPLHFIVPWLWILTKAKKISIYTNFDCFLHKDIFYCCWESCTQSNARERNKLPTKQ